MYFQMALVYEPKKDKFCIALFSNSYVFLQSGRTLQRRFKSIFENDGVQQSDRNESV